MLRILGLTLDPKQDGDLRLFPRVCIHNRKKRETLPSSPLIPPQNCCSLLGTQPLSQACMPAAISRVYWDRCCHGSTAPWSAFQHVPPPASAHQQSLRSRHCCPLAVLAPSNTYNFRQPPGRHVETMRDRARRAAAVCKATAAAAT